MRWKFFLTVHTLFFLSGTSLAKTYILGGDRPAKLLTPDSRAETEKLPLVVFLHGFTGNAEGSDWFFDISSQRETLGFAALLPNGTKNSRGYQFWNATPECCDFEQSGVDDAGYLAALIQEAATQAAIDLGRVYIIGHSNGGFMSYRMACDYPELIRGIISIAGAFFVDPKLCKKPGRLNVLQIHGSSDTTIPFESSNGFPGAQTSVKFWADLQGCQSEARQITSAWDLTRPTSESEPSLAETDTLQWDDCYDAAQVGLWKMNGIGHTPYFNSSWLAKALDFVK